MSIFVFAVIGFLIGSVAAKAIRGQSRAGVVGDLGMGFVGSVTAGWLVQVPFGLDNLSTVGVIAAIVGGIVVVGIERLAVGERVLH